MTFGPGADQVGSLSPVGARRVHRSAVLCARARHRSPRRAGWVRGPCRRGGPPSRTRTGTRSIGASTSSVVPPSTTRPVTGSRRRAAGPSRSWSCTPHACSSSGKSKNSGLIGRAPMRWASSDSRVTYGHRRSRSSRWSRRMSYAASPNDRTSFGPPVASVQKSGSCGRRFPCGRMTGLKVPHGPRRSTAPATVSCRTTAGGSVYGTAPALAGGWFTTMRAPSEGASGGRRRVSCPSEGRGRRAPTPRRPCCGRLRTSPRGTGRRS
jgi:hypothetical protein